MTSSNYHLCFWLTHCRWEVPTVFSLKLSNCLEQFTELKEALYLLYDSFIIKETIREQPYERGVGQVTWEWMQSFHSLLEPLQVHQPWSSPNPVIVRFMETSLLRHNQLHHWLLMIELNLQALSLSWRCRVGERWWIWKLQPSNHIIGSTDNQLPSFGAFQKSPY